MEIIAAVILRINSTDMLKVIVPNSCAQIGSRKEIIATSICVLFSATTARFSNHSNIEFVGPSVSEYVE